MGGRIAATPAAVTQWASRFHGREVYVAVQACTGWLFVCDALVAAGAVAHLAEPGETPRAAGTRRAARATGSRAGRGRRARASPRSRRCGRDHRRRPPPA